MFLGHSLKGQGSVTSIWCSVASVHLISPCSSAKTLSNSAKRSRAFSLFSGIQDSSPNRSSFSKIFSLLSLMDSYSASFVLDLSRASRVPGNNTFSGMALAATMWLTEVPFSITTGWSLVLYKETCIF